MANLDPLADFEDLPSEDDNNPPETPVITTAAAPATPKPSSIATTTAAKPAAAVAPVVAPTSTETPVAIPISVKPEPAEPTTYETEYLPQQRKYFGELVSNPKIKPYMLASILEETTANAQKAFMQRNALQEASLSNRNRQISYDTAKIQIDAAREKAANQRSMFSALADLAPKLTSIIQDPNRSFSEKRRDTGLLHVNYSAVSAINPAVASAFAAAQSSLIDDHEKSFTKMDYFKNGGSNDVMSKYESDLGRKLENNDEVPVDLLGAGKESTIRSRQQYEEKTKAASEAASEEKANRHEFLKDIMKVELPKDVMTGKPAETWGKANSEQLVSETISRYGSPEEKKAFGDKKISVHDKLSLAQKIASGILSGSRPPVPQAPKRSSILSGFTTPSK